MKVFLASAERYSGGLVAAMERAGHQVVAVISPARGVYEHHRDQRFFFWYEALRGWNILRTCKSRGIEFRVSAKLGDGAMRALIKLKRPDLLVVFGWPTLIPDDVLGLFPRGGMNIHPSLLPKMRGADPLFGIIDQDVPAFGLTFHSMTSELDSGPIHLQVPLQRRRADGYDILYRRALRQIARQLPEALARLEINPGGHPQAGEPSHSGRFRQPMRILDPRLDFERSWRRTLACECHHTRLTSCGTFLIHFTQCRPVEGNLAPLAEPGTVLNAGGFSMLVRLGDRPARLSGLRFHGRPRWMTPLLLPKIAGTRLGSAEQTRHLWRKAGG